MYLLTNSEKSTIEPDQLDSKFFQTSTQSEVRSLPELDKFYEQEKRKRIAQAVKTSGNITQAASRLGVSRTTLHTLLTRMGMRTQLLKSE